MRDWSDWQKCKRLVLVYAEESSVRAQSEVFEDVETRNADVWLIIRKGACETFVRASALEGIEVEWAEEPTAEAESKPRCGRCGGVGRVRTNAGPSCPDSDFQACPECFPQIGGMLVLENDERVCDVCEGRGWLYVRPEDETRVDCKTCCGRGKVKR